MTVATATWTTPQIALALGGALTLLAGASVTGWLAPGAPQVATLSVVRHGGAAGEAEPFVRPGGALVADVDALQTDLAVPPPPRPVTAVAVVRRPAGLTPAPVMHDVGPVFRARTSAIVRLPNGHLAVLLAAGAGPGPGDGRSRLLHVGESFDDRWRLTGLNMNEATLADGKSTERVPLFGEAVGVPAPAGDPQ